MNRSLFVINPNSSTEVTRNIDAALEPLRTLASPIVCKTLSEGPLGIESQKQADLVIAPLLKLAGAL